MRPAGIVVFVLLVLPVAESWWTTGSHVIFDPRVTCRKSRRLRGKLAQICKNETRLLKEISRGVSLGASECQYQFQNRRWNCTLLRSSMKKILMRDTRETAFVDAIAAAGVAYTITRGCTSGELLECSCERGRPANLKKDPQPPAGPRWEWGGCSDNIQFGMRKSRVLMDVMHKKKGDVHSLIKLHNHNAGRLVVKNSMQLECKCHGLSGSCTLKTCWLKMSKFREVGNKLKEILDGATKVMASNKGDKIIPVATNLKRPGKYDLVYSEESPDFCELDTKTGSLGTKDRNCNATSHDLGGCSFMCCGRGHTERMVVEKVNCRCQFKWCCNVTCDTCLRNRTIYTCL